MSPPSPAAWNALWAKLGRADSGERTWHPLLCHLLDVAAVAGALWDEVLTPASRRSLASALGLEEALAKRWVSFLAGLHDLGKSSPAFQSKDAAAASRLQSIGLVCAPPASPVPHGTVTGATLGPILQQDHGVDAFLARTLALVVGGHHGVFPTSEEIVRVPTAADGGGPWREVRRAHVQALATLLGVPRTVPTGRLHGALALVLAGLVTVADWIGSNVDYFTHAVRGDAPTDLDVAAYWSVAREHAHHALAALGWLAWPRPRPPADFAALFPGLIPRPLQTAAAALAPTLRGPGLVIIEAPTGEGKTEAAFFLADVWNATLDQQGAYIALPTQATSNQMFGRVRDFLARRYAEEWVHLRLLHGHAALSAEFEILRRRGMEVFEPRGVEDDGPGGSAPGLGSVVAAEWFTHRKRGLLAPFGVGTVDQVLLAVLQSRHVFVRLFGLAHKTIIVDEVHAYDVYMTALLERLLEWLAALGSPVILLSATLPRARRRALVAAYAKGLAMAPQAEAPGPPYPRIVWLTEEHGGARSMPPVVSRTVQVHLVDGGLPDATGGAFPLGEALRVTLGEGGCAAVVCNTIGRAQTVYRALQPLFAGQATDGAPELDLLHARYPFEMREAREQRVLRRFGKPGPETGRPSRAVLVATQVIEQSLDLDFDLLVTDLAPVDLVLQRVGRLQRHARPRPPGLQVPVVWLCRPDLDDEGTPHLASRHRTVYDRHVLLRSWLSLRDRRVVRIPEEVETLIEDVYDPDRGCPPDLSPALHGLWRDTLADLRANLEADRQEAEVRWLRPPHYDYDGSLSRLVRGVLEEDAPDFHPAHQALTRLADPSVPIVLAWRQPEGLSLDPTGMEAIDLTARPSPDSVVRLLRRSVPVTHRGLVPRLLAQAPPPGWQRSPWLRHHRLVALDRDARAQVEDYTLTFDVDVGLVIETSRARTT